MPGDVLNAVSSQRPVWLYTGSANLYLRVTPSKMIHKYTYMFNTIYFITNSLNLKQSIEIIIPRVSSFYCYLFCVTLVSPWSHLLLLVAKDEWYQLRSSDELLYWFQTFVTNNGKKQLDEVFLSDYWSIRLSEGRRRARSRWVLLRYQIRMLFCEAKLIFWRGKSLHLTTLDLFDFCFVEPELDVHNFMVILKTPARIPWVCAAPLQRTLGNIQYYGGSYAESLKCLC